MRHVAIALSAIALSLAGAAEAVDAAENCALRRVAALDIVVGRVPLVEAQLAGHRRRMVLDTGAFWSSVFKGTVRELALPTNPSPVRAVGVAGEKSTELVRIPDAVIGNIPLADHQFMVFPGGNASDVIGENGVAGLIGAEIFKIFDVDFDFPASKLNLFSPDHCEGKVVYWSGGPVAIVPFKLEDGAHITFPVKVNGKRATALLDTGMSDTSMNLSVAKRLLDLDVDSPSVQRIGNLAGTGTYRTRVDSIEIEGLAITNPMVNLLPDAMGRTTRRTQIGSLVPVSELNLPDVLLGMTTLTKLHVYIAYKERNLYITSGNPEPAAVAAPAPASAAPAPAP
jgi:predicted aspartyl protease